MAAHVILPHVYDDVILNKEKVKLADVHHTFDFCNKNRLFSKADIIFRRLSGWGAESSTLCMGMYVYGVW